MSDNESNENIEVQSIKSEENEGEVLNMNNDNFEKIIEVNEEEEEEDSREEVDEVNEADELQNQSKAVVFKDLTEKQKKLMSSEPSIVIEKLDNEVSEMSEDNQEIEVNEEDEDIEIDVLEDENSDVIYEKSFTIQEKMAKSEKEKIYVDETIMIQEIQNQLLNALPVTKQSLLYVQKRIEREARKIMDTRKMGIDRFEMIEKGIDYDYNVPWIVPIVLDKHKVYIILQEEVVDKNEMPNVNMMMNENNENSGFTESKEDPQGIQQENQKEQMKKIKELESATYQKSHRFDHILNDIQNIIKPYVVEKTLGGGDLTSEPKEVGYYYQNEKSTLAIRYYDIDSIYWNSHQILNQISTYNHIEDEHGHISDIQEETLIPSEGMNVVGFMVLPKAGKESTPITSVFTPSNYQSNYLNKFYQKVGSIEKAIISQDQKSILITITNHQLSSDQHYVIIEDCDYSPNINGIHRSVQVIDANTISIKNKRKIPMLRGGTKGTLYSLNRLQYDLYQIEMNGENIVPQFVNTNYIDGEESNEHIKLYLFDKKKVYESNYNKILQKIAPSLTDIIESEKESFERCDTLEEMEEVLKPYHIKLSQLHQQQIEILEEILKKNLEKFEKDAMTEEEMEIPKFMFHENNKLIMQNPNLFLADVYIESPFIQRYYSKYPHIHLSQDSLIGRLSWILSQYDHGLLYINYVLYENIEEFEKNHDKGDIISMIESTKNSMDELDKTLRKEIDLSKKDKKTCKLYHYEALPITSDMKVASLDEKTMVAKEGDKIAYYLPNGTVFYYEDKLQIVDKGKAQPLMGTVDGVMALVGEHIYIWNGTDKWEKSEILPKYHQIRFLCDFQDMDIQEIDLDTLDCVYREKTGCNSRLIGRLKEKIQFLEDTKVEFEELKEYINQHTYKNKIEQNIQHIIFKYFSKDITSVQNELKINRKVEEKRDEKEKKKKEEEKEELKSEEEMKNEHPELTSLIYQINQMKNDDLKKELINQLIEKDGLLIGKTIYSKKYQCKMNGICGHKIFDIRMNRTTNVERRTLLLTQMLTKFGDSGEAEHEKIKCTECGTELGLVDYDIVEGYSSSGAFIVNRGLLEEETEDKFSEIERIALSIAHDCGSEQFQKLLAKEGYFVGDDPNILRFCEFIIEGLCEKTGVSITTQELINIIKDSMIKAKSILSPPQFIEAKKRLLMDEDGLPERTIKELEIKGYFKQLYDRYYRIKWRSIVASRFLVSVQTALPTFIRSPLKAVGNFISFDGKHGIQYLGEIFGILNFVSFGGKESSMNERSTFETEIEKCYKEFIQLPHIREFYRKKAQYVKELKDKRSLTLDGDEPIQIRIPIYKRVEPLPEDFEEKLLKSKNMNEFEKQIEHLIQRIYYLGQEMKRIIRETIDKDPLIDQTSPFVEKFCCLETLDDYVDYYTYIQIKYPNHEKESIYQYIDESKKLYNIFNHIYLNKGSISFFTLRGEQLTHFLINPIIVLNPETVSQSIIQETFYYYVNTGKYVGTLRDYIGSGLEAKDVKSGLTRKEIESKEYTKEEFQKLLSEIVKKNTKIPVKKNTEKEEEMKIRLLEFKKSAQEKLRSDISVLVQNIASVLNKTMDTQFIQKYIRFIENMGIFTKDFVDRISPDLEFDEKINPEHKRFEIKSQQLKDEYRLLYIKRVFNDYFRKYLSLIRHNYNPKELEELTFVTKDVSEEMVNEIALEQLRFRPYFEPNIQPFFKDLSFQSTYQDIENIHGTNSIFNFTNKLYEGEIIYHSSFDINDASLVILHLLVKELNQLIMCVREDKMMKEKMMEKMRDMDAEEMEKKIMDIGSKKCKAICEFMLTVFSLVERDEKLLSSCFEKLNIYKNSLIRQVQLKAKKNLEDELENTDNFFMKVYNIQQMKTQSGARIGEVEEELENEQSEFDKEMDKNDKEEAIQDRLQKISQEKGRPLSEDEKAELTQMVMNEMENEDMLDEEENQLMNVIDEDTAEDTYEILGDGDYGDVVQEHDGDI